MCICLCVICSACNHNQETIEYTQNTTEYTTSTESALTTVDVETTETVVDASSSTIEAMLDALINSITDFQNKIETMQSIEESTIESEFETDNSETIVDESVETIAPTSTAQPETEPSLETEPIPETQPVATYPKTYDDGANNITVYQENYGNAVVYAAHLVFTDYRRFGMFTGASTVSEAYNKTDAIFAVNGDYSSACNYVRSRMGTVLKDGSCYAEGLYNANNGLFFFGGEGSATGGQSMSSLVANGQATDTFQFGPAFLRDGQILCGPGGNLRPRTFMGTNGNAGDLWIVVANGDYADGQSAGLNGYECAAYLQSKGCTFGIPLDGGGSSEMMFLGEILNCPSDGHERGGLNDFVIFK